LIVISHFQQSTAAASRQDSGDGQGSNSVVLVVNRKCTDVFFLVLNIAFVIVLVSCVGRKVLSMESEARDRK